MAVYTFTIDTAIKGVDAGEDIEVAASQDNSNARTFEIGKRYFLAPSASVHDLGGGDLTGLAPYSDNACSPTAALDALSPAFAEQWPTSSTPSPTGGASPSTTEGAMVDDGSTGDNGAGAMLLGVVAVVVVAGIGAVLLVRRLRR